MPSTQGTELMKLLVLNTAGTPVELTDAARTELQHRLKSLLNLADDVRESLTILRTRVDLLPKRRGLSVLRQDIDDVAHKVNRLMNSTDIGQMIFLLELNRED